MPVTETLPVCVWEVTLPFDPAAPKLGKVAMKDLQFDGSHSNEFEAWLVFRALPWLRRQVWALPRVERGDTVKRLIARAGVLEYLSLDTRYSVRAQLGPHKGKLVIRAEDRGRAAVRLSEKPYERLPYTVVGKESDEPEAHFVRLTDQEFELMNQACSFVRKIGFRRKPAICFVRDVAKKIRELNDEAREEA